MSQTRMDEILEIVLTDKNSKQKLKKLGITQKELEKYIDSILTKPERSYNRILSSDEKKVISPPAYGYLMHLLMIDSIDSIVFEKVITVCLQLYVFIKKQINKDMMEDIVNYLIFSGEREISIKELMDIFYLETEDGEYDEEIN